MLLRELEITDFGVFRGTQTIDLAPRVKYGAVRPVILFGGLNGAGKTTILTAVRFALYGRQALGFGTSQRAYEEAINDQIHKSPHPGFSPGKASISLVFTYSQLGTSSVYKVTREWIRKGAGISETLVVKKDGEKLTGYADEQSQAFLNQLVPVGVSELFFFDGEKIASLASDDGEAALSASIRRLLGLEVVDKLRSDLVVYSRQARAKSNDTGNSERLQRLSVEFEELNQEIDRLEHQRLPELTESIRKKSEEVEHLQALLDFGGGAWARSRNQIQGRVDDLEAEKKKIEGEILKEVSGLYPLVLAETELRKIANSLSEINPGLSVKDLQKTFSELEKEFAKNLDKTSFKKVKGLLNSYLSEKKKVRRTDSQFSAHSPQTVKRISSVIYSELDGAKARAKVLRERYELLTEEIAQSAVSLAAAPPEETIAEDLGHLKVASEGLGALRAERKTFLEDLRAKISAAIDLSRQIRNLEESLEGEVESSVAIARATSSISMLEEFGQVLTSKKVQTLRKHFIEVFGRLARKDDLVVDAEIDEESFSVTLLGKDGERIPKKVLSAGEKQVYAIAMLEALAKTSGRNLPIIIDTPLGRLDSIHRGKLVKNYFPCASHQVIILSTDTEVDQTFYGDLSASLSHAFHLEFDQIERMTLVREGYFWKDKERELRRVS